MTPPRILVLSGSNRTGSFNTRLAGLAAKEIVLAEGEVTRIALTDYPLPLYDGDLEKSAGVPEPAVQLARLLLAHQGVFIASPEYNAGVTPLLKNTIDWVSRVRLDGVPPLGMYKNRVFALGGASPGALGAYRSHMQLRQILELGLGATVLPPVATVARADSAFAEDGGLTDERLAGQLRSLARLLVEEARRFVLPLD